MNTRLLHHRIDQLIANKIIDGPISKSLNKNSKDMLTILLEHDLEPNKEWESSIEFDYEDYSVVFNVWDKNYNYSIYVYAKTANDDILFVVCKTSLHDKNLINKTQLTNAKYEKDGTFPFPSLESLYNVRVELFGIPN